MLDALAKTVYRSWDSFPKRKENRLDMLAIKNIKYRTRISRVVLIKCIGFFMIFSLLISLLSGCSHKKIQYPEETAMSQGNMIMSFIEKKDCAGLVDMFSTYAKDSYDLEKEVSDLINFIDGTVVSYGDVARTSMSGHYDHGRYRNIYYFRIQDIKTDSSKQYELFYTFYLSDNQNDSYNGLIAVQVRDRDKYSSENGYSPDGVKSAGDLDFDI